MINTHGDMMSLVGCFFLEPEVTGWVELGTIHIAAPLF